MEAFHNYLAFFIIWYAVYFVASAFAQQDEDDANTSILFHLSSYILDYKDYNKSFPFPTDQLTANASSSAVDDSMDQLPLSEALYQLYDDKMEERVNLKVGVVGSVTCRKSRGLRRLANLTVRLFDENDGTLLATVYTDADGQFNISGEHNPGLLAMTTNTTLVVLHRCSESGRAGYKLHHLPQLSYLDFSGKEYIADMDLTEADDRAWYVERQYWLN